MPKMSICESPCSKNKHICLPMGKCSIISVAVEEYKMEETLIIHEANEIRTCQNKQLFILGPNFHLGFLSPPVLMHSALLCIALRLSVTGPKNH